MPEFRVSPADAAEMGLADRDVVEVATEAGSAQAVVRIVAQLAAGTLAIAEGYVAARRLLPYAIDSERNAVVSAPAAVRVSKAALAAKR